MWPHHFSSQPFTSARMLYKIILLSTIFLKPLLSSFFVFTFPIPTYFFKNSKKQTSIWIQSYKRHFIFLNLPHNKRINFPSPFPNIALNYNFVSFFHLIWGKLLTIWDPIIPLQLPVFFPQALKDFMHCTTYVHVYKCAYKWFGKFGFFFSMT